ncbi:hypothetical protein HNQ80_003611 [Anaerosolibacter carboniphilus]|uniref:Uncharacterized protein n=1 Tax=Anaerosolibacter carboniphilus TaxID=1417629 RepID=A0A841KZU6_9FIRM|nr:hypothetical protein [Anaerosolibacter carboniphilus]MBB6217490.1 hypothetical protein [Anaerosolibacter carboniphilus]
MLICFIENSTNDIRRVLGYHDATETIEDLERYNYIEIDSIPVVPAYDVQKQYVETYIDIDTKEFTHYIIDLPTTPEDKILRLTENLTDVQIELEMAKFQNKSLTQVITDLQIEVELLKMGGI